ncbi:hypothetical protein [Microbacterium sp. JZ101]
MSGAERLCVIRAPGGMGKTTLLSQWALEPSRHGGATIVWTEGRAVPGSRAGFWLRTLTQIHARGLVDDATLYREVAAIADGQDAIVDAMRRTLEDVAAPVVLLIDDLLPEADREAIARDVIALLGAVPRLRCIIATSGGCTLEPLAREAGISMRMITEQDIALTPGEVRAVTELNAPDLPSRTRELLATSSATRRAAALRYSLTTLRRDGDPGPEGVLDRASAGFVERLDPALQDFVGITSLSPAVDVELARTLSGRDDAETLLELLEESGAGQWTRTASGQRLFRFGTSVRAEATEAYIRRHPERLAAARSRIARWLFTVLEDDLTALELALEGGDLAFASHVTLRAFPFNREDGTRAVEILRRIPAASVHRHPVLALWYGLVLRADPATHERAAEFLASATRIGRVHDQATSPWERAVHRALESVVWRLLGDAPRMLDAARRAVDLLEHAPAAPDFDRRLTAIVAAVLYQCGVSAFYADDHELARRAFSALVVLSEQHRLGHLRNAALSGLAFLDAVEGRISSAERTLARIPEAEWPVTWSSGYMGALWRLARTWVHLSDGRPQAALDELAKLDDDVDGTEHWDVILALRVLSESLVGRRQEAVHTFERTRRAYLTPTTLPSTLDRLAAISATLDLVGGSVSDVRRQGNARRVSVILRAVEAMAESVAGSHDVAAGLVARAEHESAAPVQEMFAVVAAIAVSLRLADGRDLHRLAARLASIVSAQRLRWPLALISPGDRERIVAALEEGGESGSAEVLRDAFEVMPSQLADAVWTGHLDRTSDAGSDAPRVRRPLRPRADAEPSGDRRPPLRVGEHRQGAGPLDLREARRELARGGPRACGRPGPAQPGRGRGHGLTPVCSG